MMIKFIKCLCLFIFFTQPIFSQHEVSRALVPASAFQNLMEASDLPVKEARREAELMRLIDLYRFSSFQVMQVCNTFKTEKSRLDFALAAYPNVIDQDKFYIVYDVFSKFSSAIQLYDLIKGKPNGAILNENQGIIYPLWHTYSGPENCHSVISDEDFQILYNQLIALETDNQKMSMAVSIVKNNCLSVSYAMKCSQVLHDEQLRLEIIKASFPNLFDLNNLKMASQLFSLDKTRDSFLQFINEQTPTHGYDPLPPVSYMKGCIVKDKDFADMVIMLKKQAVNNTRLSMAKQILISGKCFSIKQLLVVLQLFEFESSKIEVAKFSIDYCIEPDKCYLLADCFEFESSKKEFLTFLAGR